MNEPGEVAIRKRTRMRATDAIRARAEAMYRRKLAGYSMRQIAAEHRLTARHVRRELATIPEADRRRIELAWREALLGPGGWKLLR
jgi:formylmethanofuran dehydrogenase subunit A